MKRLFAALIGVLITLSIVGPVGAQEEVEEVSGATVLRAYSVDAVEDDVTVILAADDYSIPMAESVVVTENGVDVPVESLTTAGKAGTPLEIMFVIDTRSTMAQGSALDAVKASIASAIDGLPAGSSAGVVAAGDSAVVLQELTNDLGQARAAVDQVSLSAGGAVIDGLTRAVQQFDDRPGYGIVRSLSDEPIRSIVVVSAGDDLLSSSTASSMSRIAVQRGTQIFSVRYQGGTAALKDVVDTASGLNIAASNVEDLTSGLETSFIAASDRYLVTFDGSADESVGSDLAVTIGSASTTLSFSNGRFTAVPTALIAAPVITQSGPGFLHSGTGLYIALPLAFLAICLAIYAIGSLFFMGDVTLETMLERYSNEGDQGDLSTEETSIVQTALVQRAVEMTESFAEDRGFLTKIEELLEQARMPLRPGEAMSFLFAGMVTGAGIGFFMFGGFFGALMLSVVTGFFMFGYVRFKGKRRQKKFEKQLPDMLTLLAGTLRAGYSLPQGMDAVSHEIADPMGYEIRRVMTEAQLGREIEEALESAAERMKSPDFAWAVMAIGIQREVGGNLNELLMTVAETMIARERLRGEVAALTAEGKMTSFLLGGLPPGLGVVMWIMNPEYIEQLFITGMGNVLLGLGALFMVIGMAWMKKVMTINV